MTRIYTVPRVKVAQSEYYDKGLGIYVKNAWDVGEHIKRCNDKNGTDLRQIEPGMVKPKKEGINLSKNEIEQICERIDAPEVASA